MVGTGKSVRHGYTISPLYLERLGNENAVDRYIASLELHSCHPGELVRLKQDQIGKWIAQSDGKPQMADYVSVLRSLKNVGDKELEVEHVYVDDVGDVLYKFTTSDLKVHADFCSNHLPFIHEYGILTVHDGNLWFVHIDDTTGNAKQAYAISKELGRVARHQLAAHDLETLINIVMQQDGQAMAGEFAVEDHGNGAWGLLYSPWSTSCNEVELGRAIRAIGDVVDTRPTLN